MRLLYLSSPYSGNVLDNIAHALGWGVHVAIEGAHPIIPHTSFPEATSWDEAMALCRTQLNRCHAIFLLPGWEQSKGARQERDWALEMGLPVFESMSAVREWVKEAA